MGLSQYKNKPLREVLKEAHRLADTEEASLANAHDLFQLCTKPTTDKKLLGHLRGKIWNIEKSFGHHSVFLFAAGQDHCDR